MSKIIRGLLTVRAPALDVNSLLEQWDKFLNLLDEQILLLVFHRDNDSIQEVMLDLMSFRDPIDRTYGLLNGLLPKGNLKHFVNKEYHIIKDIYSLFIGYDLSKRHDLNILKDALLHMRKFRNRLPKDGTEYKN